MMVEPVRERADAPDRSSSAVIEPWSAELVTRSGYAFQIRPAGLTDEPALAEFFMHVDKEDLRFRFLTAIQRVGHDQLQALVNVDHNRTENFLASSLGPG